MLSEKGGEEVINQFNDIEMLEQLDDDLEKEMEIIERFSKNARTNEFINLVKENPDMPIIPMVDAEVVGGDDYGCWMGCFGYSRVEDVYLGSERLHIKDDEDEEEVLCDLAECKYCRTPDGKDIYDLPEEEWDALYKSIPWIKAIVVYITT